MSFVKNPQPTVAYCVQAHEVQTVEPFDFSGTIYPSASAEYSYSIQAEDEDFCDIIADLAQGEYCDFEFGGPSAVALPVEDDGDHDGIPEVSIAVPEEEFSTSYNIKKGIHVISADAVVNAWEVPSEEEFKLKFASLDNTEEEILLKKKAQDQKYRRLQAVHRLKEKRKQHKNKSNQIVVKSIETNHRNNNFTTNITEFKEKKSKINARQAAAAQRERVKGKFKHNKTRWIAVTEFLRHTHLNEEETGAGEWEDKGGHTLT